MNADKFIDKLKLEMVPAHYSKDFSERVGLGRLLFRKGAYLFLALPFEEVPCDDYNSDMARGVVKKAVFSFPIIAEKSLFLVYYGKREVWSEVAHKFKVDMTGLRSVILQSIHFVDSETGDNVNSQTGWGPIKFGLCGKVIETIELMCNHT